MVGPSVFPETRVIPECMRGVVGQKEWRSVRMFNVQRINSLDTQPMLMLLTKTSVHFFSNFKIASKSGHDLSLNHMGQVEGDVSIILINRVK